jgi:hypothetical protein
MPEQVARFDSLATVAERLKSPVSRHFLDYYAGLQEGGVLPGRAAIDPIALKPCLPYMVIMDCQVPAAPRYRLAGEAYIQLLGANPVGRPYLDFVPPERHATASEAYVACMQHRCGMLTELVTVTRVGREVLCEALNLPVCDQDGGAAARYLYVTLVPFGDRHWDLDQTRFSRYSEVRFRGFIDVGSGTPDRFGGDPVAQEAIT